MKKHKDTNVPNLWVLKLLTSLKSKGLVKEKFNWQWYYWYLTNEGIEYLRDYLNLDANIVPATLKKPAAAPRAYPPRVGGGERPAGGPRGDREGGYRRPYPGDQEKKLAGAGGDFAPRFVRLSTCHFPLCHFSVANHQIIHMQAGREGEGRGFGGRGGRDSYRRDGAPSAGGFGDRAPRPSFGRGGGAPRE